MDLNTFLDKYGNYIELGILCASIFFFGQIVGIHNLLMKRI